MKPMKISVKVKPRAGRQSVVEGSDGSLAVQLKSPPVAGRANQELIKLLAQYYGVRQADVTICCGAGSRQKVVEIAGLAADEA